MKLHDMKRTIPALLLVGLLAACSHKPAKVAVPQAPPPAGQSQPITAANAGEAPGITAQPLPEIPEIQADAKPLWSETGIASWYGAPYHNRRGSNGEIYDMHAMTAAHRTLPLGSTVRVTDVKTGSSAVVRITDRGPFIEGRIIDLSRSAAEKVGIVQRGTAEVRIDVLKTPTPMTSGGRWAVQIGAFEREQAARELASHLSRRYRTANVLTFDSPVGDWWVRIRVKGDVRDRAEEVMHDTKTSQGAIFLVRLD
jgi:rare lipoprotein A